MNPLHTYQVYLGMKLHFTQKAYDYTKYGPKRVSEESSRKFLTLAGYVGNKFQTQDEFENRLIALFKHKVVWLNEVHGEDAKIKEKKHIGEIESLSYNLEQDLRLLKDCNENIIECFQVRHSFDIPMVYRKLLNKEIKIESFICLDRLLNFSQHMNDVVWVADKLRIEKYGKFLNVDIKKIAKITKPFFV